MKKNFCSLGHFRLGLGFTMLVSGIALGQVRNITGQVVYHDKPLEGVVVKQQGSDVSSMTDKEGRFILSVDGKDAVLEFEHPDYANVTERVDNRQVLKVSFIRPVNEIGEVLINAGYYSVKDKERTGSIAKVTAKDIENQPVNNVLSAVQGRMAGVSITQNSGTPGGGYDVQIRGRNSLRTYLTGGKDGNQPLYIIDGTQIPYLNEYKSGLSQGVLPYGDINPLNNISTNDIESITVLKDADATAIYGAKGANGVILITTKNGKKGTKAWINQSWGTGSIANLPTMMDTETYVKMRKQAFKNDGITELPINAYDVNGKWDEARDTDWQKYFVGNHAEMISTQIGVSGGSENTNFLLSGGHNEETSVFAGSYRYKKNNFRVNVGHESKNKDLKINFSGYYTEEKNILPPLDFSMVYGNIAPNAPNLFMNNGELNWEDNTFINPLAAASQTFESYINNLTASLNINYKIAKGLHFILNNGFGKYNTLEQRIYPKTFYNPAYNIGSQLSALRKVNMVNTNWLIEPQLDYSYKFGRSQVNILFGSSFQEQTSDNLSLLGRGFASDELINSMSSAKTVMVENALNFRYRYQGLYTRLNYNFADKYILSLSGRRDGSSRFGRSKRFANFGAIGLAWVFSKEKYFDNSSWLSFGKLRTSYGIAGSDQIGDYQFYDTYISTSDSYNNVPGIQPIRHYNSNFGWEVAKKFEVALETSYFKDRMQVGLSWYRNTGSSQLMALPLSEVTGFSSVQSNLNATVLNSGIELQVGLRVLEKGAWKYSTNLNLTVPQNRLLSYPNLAESAYSNYFEVGKSTNLVKLYKYTGIDPTTGHYTFEDHNHDGKIDQKDKYVSKEIKDFWYGGIQNSIQYKNISLDFNIQFISQNQRNIYAQVGYLGLLKNLPKDFADYWSPENPNATFQAPSAGYNAEAGVASSRFMDSDISVSKILTVRLKNVSLSYQLPNGLLKKANVKIYLEGQNLLSISNYKGQNPEFSLPGYISPLRTVSMGVNLTY